MFPRRAGKGLSLSSSVPPSSLRSFFALSSELPIGVEEEKPMFLWIKRSDWVSRLFRSSRLPWSGGQGREHEESLTKIEEQKASLTCQVHQLELSILHESGGSSWSRAALPSIEEYVKTREDRRRKLSVQSPYTGISWPVFQILGTNESASLLLCSLGSGRSTHFAKSISKSYFHAGTK